MIRPALQGEPSAKTEHQVMVLFKQQQVIKDGRKDALALLRKYVSLGEGAVELASVGGWGNVGVSTTRLGESGV